MAKDIIMALEILSMNNEVDESKMFEASNMIEELLKTYSDSKMQKYIKILSFLSFSVRRSIIALILYSSFKSGGINGSDKICE